MRLTEAPVKISHTNLGGSLEHLFATAKHKQSVLETKNSIPLNLTYKYGMLMTYHNSKCLCEGITRHYKRQYQSLLKSVGKKVSRDNVIVSQDLPTRDQVNQMILKKIPMVVAGIHDYPTEDKDGIVYQHQHSVIYNIHHHLPDPSEGKKLDRKIQTIKNNQYRYLNSKYRKGVIDIRPIGLLYHTQDRDWSISFYDYLLKSLNKSEGNILNYIRTNRHFQDRNYDLDFIYATKL